MQTFAEGPLSSFGLNMVSIDPNDITFSLRIRNDPTEANVLINMLKDKGIFGRLDQVNQALDNCDYTTLLPFVWSERNKPARLQWLRENAKLHTLLLFEQGLAEIAMNPTIETVQKIAHPLSIAAELRLQQDAVCFADQPGMDDRIRKISGAYVTALNRLVNKHNLPLDEVTDQGNPSVNQKIREKVIEKMAEFIETETPPPPDWLATKSHGLVRNGENPMKFTPRRYAMLSEEEIKQRRLQFATDTIERMRHSWRLD